MSMMIRTLAKARLLNTGNRVMKQTMIRKYNTNIDVHRQSKFRDLDKAGLFFSSMFLGGIVGAIARPVKVYKDERKKGRKPNFDFGCVLILEAPIGAMTGSFYFITIPVYLLTMCVDMIYDILD